tara:strand:- start:278 stop:538 length:261 start_codon:yes stop_codon:yes gene_type:complete
MGKKNLDSILIKDEKVLPSKENETLNEVPTKPKREIDSRVISIKITETELQNMKDKAGRLVPLGAYVKDYIRTKTDLFSKSVSDEK